MVHDYYIYYHMIGKETAILMVRSAHVAANLYDIQRDGGIIEQIQAICDDPVHGYCACCATFYDPVATHPRRGEAG